MALKQVYEELEQRIKELEKESATHKRAEEKLRFTQFAVDHTADAEFWMTNDARFFYVNEAACRALCYSRDELLKLFQAVRRLLSI